MISSRNPPFPASVQIENSGGDDSSSMLMSDKHPAQRLLRLIRLVGKENPGEATYEASMDELVELMNSLIILFSRRGLLQGDKSKAEKMISSTVTTQGGKTTSSRGKKKAAGKKSNTNDLQIAGAEEDAASANSGQQIAETFIFTALTRILTEVPEARAGRADDSSLVLSLGAEMCVAMIQYVQANKNSSDQNACIVAEYELMAQSGKAILSGLVTKMQSLHSEIRDCSNRQGGERNKSVEACLATAKNFEECPEMSPVQSCLRAACALVNLFGIKLSRSTTLLADLRSIAWKFVVIPQPLIQEAAARLLAALPLAGGVDRQTPAELWNQEFHQVLCMISTLVETVAPIGNSPSSKENCDLSSEGSVIFQGWVSCLQRGVNHADSRARAFLSMLKGLTLTYRHFLSRDLNGNSFLALSESKVDIELMLEIAESFLSYPMSAESVFFRTKKRLRDEVVDGGLISSRVIATTIANEVKFLGHDMFDCLINSIGGSALLPYARRIFRVAYAALLTSCSAPVRKIMDPSSAAQLEGKKRRWLYLSLSLRTRAVDTVGAVIVAFGSDRTAKIDSSGTKSKSDGELAITLVAGCLMEQMGATDVENDIEECWGTLSERVALVTSCLQCLRGVIPAVGGFLGIGTRSMIDSMVHTSLVRISERAGGDPLACSSVQAIIFRLANVCVSTPWNDGAASSITKVLKSAALRACNDSNEEVSLAAMEALRVCDSFETPRVQPLVFVHKTLKEEAERYEALAPKAITEIQTAQVESKRTRVEAAEAEKSKLQEKRMREMEKEESSKRKRQALEAEREEIINSAPTVVAALPDKEKKTYLDERELKLVDEEDNKEVTIKVNSTQEKDKNENPEQAKREDEETRSTDDEEFPDIDIVADGPDSDDD